MASQQKFGMKQVAITATKYINDLFKLGKYSGDVCFWKYFGWKVVLATVFQNENAQIFPSFKFYVLVCKFFVFYDPTVLLHELQ